MKQLLSDSIDDYLRFRRSQDYSKATVAQDTQILKRFLATVGNVWMHVIDEKHVNRHFEAANKTRKSSSLTNDHGVLNRFFLWARKTGRMPVDSDPMFGRRQPRATVRERNRIAVHEFGRLLDEAGARDPRDRALVAVLLYTLQRDSEVVDLRIRDLDLPGGWLTTRIPKSRLEDKMPVCEELDQEMRRWLTYYTEQVGVLDPGYYLIPSRGVRPVHDGRGRITKHDSFYRPTKQIRQTGRIVTPILERIGFPVTDADGKPCGEGSHTIRRSGARALFDQLVTDGYDHSLRVVQSMLHHKNQQQTEHYIGVTADRRSRDEIIRHKRMYAASDENVVRLAR